MGNSIREFSIRLPKHCTSCSILENLGKEFKIVDYILSEKRRHNNVYYFRYKYQTSCRLDKIKDT